MSSLHREILKAAPEELRAWFTGCYGRQFRFCLLVILIGCAGYGFSIGVWRSTEMGFYVALKLPCLVFLTLTLNAVLNVILGLLLGFGRGFRDCFLCQLMSFSVAALILGSLSPITFLMALDAPAPDSAEAGTAHAVNLLIHTTLIGIAGITANRHLFRLLRSLAPSEGVARRILLCWLAGNAFLGAQLSWILRPFLGNPRLEVAFLRDHPMQGTFYEAVWRALTRVIPPITVWIILISLVGILCMLLHHSFSEKTKPLTKHN